ncbi:unnamed protein product [Mytilus coruscus]|uniref:Uncharacterized protein n=1 Tax=Mytilus coruscus TaxID=42192 RepID=A0A6J8EBC6_MYTCO|nr:unnamed protein product [Mytilus coruscus]
MVCNTMSDMTDNPGIDMFSNNNYLPDIGQFSNQGNNGYVQRCRLPSTNQGAQFTFAVPTRASSYTLGHVGHTHQPRGLYSIPISQQGMVPGFGASWQHSVPNQMPWTENWTAPTTNFGITTFTAIPTMSVPSFSIYRKDAPISKCRVTAEKMVARMEGLSLINNGSPSGCEKTEYQFQPALDYDLNDMATSSTTCSTMSGGWERFREIENRLNSESDDEDLPDEDGVKVHITESIAKNILESQPLIPQKILDNFHKPCMEVVLWKSPVTTSSHQPLLSPPRQISVDSNSSKDMEAESCLETYDDEMDL